MNIYDNDYDFYQCFFNIDRNKKEQGCSKSNRFFDDGL